MRVKQLTKNDLTPELVSRCNATAQRYLKANLWTLPSLRRQYNQHLVYSGDESFLFSIEDDTDCAILVAFPDIILGDSDKYGVDIAHKWYYYDADLVELCPLLKPLKKLRDTASIEVPYPVYIFYADTDYDLKSLSKRVSGNFNSHLFGEKSKQLVVTHYTLSHNKDVAQAYADIISVLKMYGIEKWHRFGVLGGDLDTNKDMYDILWHIDNLMYITDSYVTVITDQDGTPLGFISYFTRDNIGYTHEIICSTDEQHKKFSLVPTLHLYALSQLWSMGCTRVNLGYNFDSSGDYKSFLKNLNSEHFKVNLPLVNTFEEAKQLTLSLGVENNV